MKNPNLLDQLVSDLKPVNVFSPFSGAVKWFAVALILVLASVYTLPLRDFTNFGLSFYSVAVSSVIVSFLLAYSAYLSGIPARTDAKTITAVALSGYLLFSFSLLFLSLQNTVEWSGVDCAKIVGTFSIVPTLLALFFMKKLASARPAITGLLIALSASSLGGFAIAFHCPEENWMHLLLHHFLLPGFVVGIGSVLLSRKLLRW